MSAITELKARHKDFFSPCSKRFFSVTHSGFVTTEGLLMYWEYHDGSKTPAGFRVWIEEITQGATIVPSLVYAMRQMRFGYTTVLTEEQAMELMGTKKRLV